MLKDFFVKQGIKVVEIEQFIRQAFPMGDYSMIELQRTPLGVKIIIYTNKPGRIIGRGGKNINDMTEAIKQKFELENPQIDVKSVEHPDLDAKIVAKQITSALERGYNYKKIGNITIKRIMDAGALGTEIVISGKLGGSKGLTSKFLAGYIKHCGQTAKELVDEGFETAQTKPGMIGVRVRIMREFQDITGKRWKEIPQKLPLEPVSEVVEEPAEHPGKAEKEHAGEVPELKPARQKKAKTEKGKRATKPKAEKKAGSSEGTRTKTNKKTAGKK